MRSLQYVSCVAAAGALLGISVLRAQTAAIAPRVVQAVDDSSLVTLKGNVTALARPQFDKGEADPGLQMSSVRLVLSRSPEQESALEQLMAEQLDKSSPNYHKWLTPQEFGKLYGPADSDIAAITAWLESHGLHVDSVSPGRTDVAFSGSVSQIEQAFHTHIHSFNANGRLFYSNTTNPSIPAAFASVVSGVGHLNTLEPRPLSVRTGSATYDPGAKRFVPDSVSATGARPEFTNGSGTNSFLYVVAGDAATIYDTPNSFNANFSGTSYTGQGVTIGIGGNGQIQASTVQNYRKLFLGDSTAPTINVVNSAVANSDTDEAYLDTEVAGALAPKANIVFYVDANLDSAIQKAINDNTVDIFSLSFGACEMDLTTADNNLVNGWWQQAATQGIAVTVSTGDSGAAGCDNPNTEQVAIHGNQVSGLASTPFNIAVGGTDYAGLLNGGFSTYASATQSSSTFYRSALKYIPESTWNDSVQTDASLSANVPYVDSNNKTNITGGSGGASSCSTNSDTVNTSGNVVVGTCTNGYAKPSWQRGTGVPNDSVRDLPDVSLLAGNGFDHAAWLVCTDDVNNGTTSNCAVTNGSFSAAGFGGTSASTPAFAGILALVQQKVGSRLGAEGAKALYDLYNSPHAAAVFHDVIQGNNSVPCTSGTPNCHQNSAGNFFLTGYDATAGYDLATGLGSVDATQLVNYWGTATGVGTSTVTVTPSASSITTGQSLTVNVTIAGSGSLGTPTGTVTLTSGTYTSTAVTLSAGAASFTIPAGSLAVGTDTLTVTYSGDSNYTSTTGTANVTVNALPKPTVTVSPASSSILVNQTLTVSIAVTGTGSTPTGTVMLSGGGYTSAATTLAAGAASITIPANSLGAGSDTLMATYSGDSNYAGTTGSASVTVTKLTPAISLTPSATSIDSSQPISIAVAVSGSGATPTGTVTVSGGGYSGTAVSLSSGAATVTIPANSLASGTDTLTMSFSGDGTYAAATATTSVTVTQSVYSVTPGTPPAAIHPGGSATETITLNTSTSYSGTITLACAPGTGNPSNASGDAPTCTVNPASVTLGGSAGSSATATVTISTTAASARMEKPRIGGWLEASSGMTLALLAFFGIPAKRRKWRAMLGMVVLLIALGAFSACGGGGGSSSSSGGTGGTTNSNPGTATGTYTFTVTGTGNPAITPAPTVTISLTIN